MTLKEECNFRDTCCISIVGKSEKSNGKLPANDKLVICRLIGKDMGRGYGGEKSIKSCWIKTEGSPKQLWAILTTDIKVKNKL